MKTMKKTYIIILIAILSVLHEPLLAQLQTVITTPTYGIFTERPEITNRFAFGDGNGNLFIWANLAAIPGAVPREGTSVLAFRSPGAGWYGLGIHSAAALNLTHFATGYLNFAVRIPSGSTEIFTVRMEGATASRGDLRFAPGQDPAGVSRDGNWHFVSIPMTTFTAQGLNLSACNNIFVIVSDLPTQGIFFDDVFLSVALPVSVPEVASRLLKIYPNPAQDQFVVGLDGSAERVEVLNMTGKIIYSATGLAGKTSVEINCSLWDSGIYIVRTIGTNGVSVSSKLSVK